MHRMRKIAIAIALTAVVVCYAMQAAYRFLTDVTVANAMKHDPDAAAARGARARCSTSGARSTCRARSRSRARSRRWRHAAAAGGGAFENGISHREAEAPAGRTAGRAATSQGQARTLTAGARRGQDLARGQASLRLAHIG